MSTRVGIRCLIVVAMGVAATAHGALAQQSDNTPSRALINAFVRMYAPADTAVTPEFDAAVPASIQSLVRLPASTAVLGTVTLGRYAYVLATSPLSPDSLMNLARREFARPGEPLVGRVEVASGTGGGFQPAPGPLPTTFCVDNHEITISAARAPEGLTSFRYRVAPAATFCARVAARTTAGPPRPPVPTSPLPMLREPGMLSGDCFAAGSQRRESITQTKMDPAALLKFYADQMVTQGWTPVDSGSAVARGVWTRRDSSGVTQMASIVVGVSPISPSCRDAAIEVINLRR